MTRLGKTGPRQGRSARPTDAGVKSGAENVEPRSDRTARNLTSSRVRRQGDGGGSEANRASLSPNGTAAARKITGSGAGVAPAGDRVESESAADCREAERVERLRAWAREWAESSVPWSDRKWRRVNNDLGYRLRDGG